jgi:hypothetical protein
VEWGKVRDGLQRGRWDGALVRVREISSVNGVSLDLRFTIPIG